jgi:hypothetical protein
MSSGDSSCHSDVPYGTKNQMTPAVHQGKQPESFLKGTVDVSFSIGFSSGSVSWTLVSGAGIYERTTTATATTTSPACATPICSDSCAAHGRCTLPKEGGRSCTCDSGYTNRLTDSRLTCDRTQTVPCKPNGTVPANATVTNPTVEVTFSGTDPSGTWSTPASCVWACNSGYHKNGSSACETNSRMVPCPNAAPANALWQPSTVQQTWNTNSGTWNAAPNCTAFICNVGYTRYAPQTGTTPPPALSYCINSAQARCRQEGTLPANAAFVDAAVTVNYVQSGTQWVWQTPAICAWACKTNFALEAGACLGTKQVPCTQSGAPQNATYVASNVPVNYSGTYPNGTWSTPARCAWTCNAGYTKNAAGTACDDNCRVSPPNCADTQPQDYCEDESTAKHFAPSNGCTAGACQYPAPTLEPCPHGCRDGKCLECEDGPCCDDGKLVPQGQACNDPDEAPLDFACSTTGCDSKVMAKLSVGTCNGGVCQILDIFKA